MRAARPRPVADRDLGKTIVIRLGATLVIAHSIKELAAGTLSSRPASTTRLACEAVPAVRGVSQFLVAG